jgi:hypothetical protein
VTEHAFFGFAGPIPKDPALFQIGRADFVETAAELQYVAGLADGFYGGVAGNKLHGRIPGSDVSLLIQCKDALSHGAYNLVEKTSVPNAVGCDRHFIGLLGIPNSVTLTSVNVNF